ncbi:hypothetical protein LQ327_31435 [Actinomycetospora endophytica]|uniref:Uncharacterized protein n=1 Tax=Actinomycetospora endophytica TaxID=2291215 RepID=A0ABS8PI42_9PSEU|nr:hypothetical protein [Actinomycetospora endophytica]MCD2197892.1 hypothetical protein [Actinomycetospora endophytica]
MTDPFLTRRTRKQLAAHLGRPDAEGTIPEARWMRAMTFESLVHSEQFVSELLTRTLGQLGLPRPEKVARKRCGGSVERTAAALAQADLSATFGGTATMITALALPYLELEHENVTAVLPDFAVVAPRCVHDRTVGSWLVMGDAKDYERVRARIDDARMLKGFLQVALGAESAAAWSKLPSGMRVHPSGSLAVPRNAFLRPEAVVERLDDHREEVRGRARERLMAKKELGDDHPTSAELARYVAHRIARFDPGSCASCNLFLYCRGELRDSQNAADILVEIGVPERVRPLVTALAEGSGAAAAAAPAAVVSQVAATTTGLPVSTARRRSDPVGRSGSIEVVVAKTDSSALGMYGLALRRAGSTWLQQIFVEPHAPATRRGALRLIGEEITAAREEGALPIHLVLPDRATGDLLVSAADSVAGVELSRMRWQRDLSQGRPALTFDGEPAVLPEPLDAYERLGVSFLLEDDRSRALHTRSTIVDLREVLARHITVGGPAIDAFRLDYLVRWALASEPLDHRAVSDEIASLTHTPGARLTTAESDALHAASRRRSGDPEAYRRGVEGALSYKQEIIELASSFLETLPLSRLAPVFDAIENDSQQVWWRRVALGALDLVRFSRTNRFWRNRQVPLLEKDERCGTQLACLVDYTIARDAAVDAGMKEVARATVLSISPIRLDVSSRRFSDGTVAVGMHVGAEPMLETPSTTLKVQSGTFKIGQMPIGRLTADDKPGLLWAPVVVPQLAVGDELLLGDATWFEAVMKNGHELTVVRPPVDNDAAPRKDCHPGSYAADPQAHRWCCRSHTVAEAETSDFFAGKRAKGEMNPETWPPLVDEERFDVGPAVPADVPPSLPPEDLTVDDVD